MSSQNEIKMKEIIWLDQKDMSVFFFHFIIILSLFPIILTRSLIERIPMIFYWSTSSWWNNEFRRTNIRSTEWCVLKQYTQNIVIYKRKLRKYICKNIKYSKILQIVKNGNKIIGNNSKMISSYWAIGYMKIWSVSIILSVCHCLFLMWFDDWNARK